MGARNRGHDYSHNSSFWSHWRTVKDLLISHTRFRSNECSTDKDTYITFPLFLYPLLQEGHTRAEFSYSLSTSTITSLHISLIADQQRPMRKTLGPTLEPVKDNLDYLVLSDQGDAHILSWSTVVLAEPACHLPLPPHGPGRMHAVPGLCLEELRKEKEGSVRGKTPNKRGWNGAISVFLCNLQQAAKPSCRSTTDEQLPFSAVTLFTAQDSKRC